MAAPRSLLVALLAGALVAAAVPGSAQTQAPQGSLRLVVVSTRVIGTRIPASMISLAFSSLCSRP